MANDVLANALSTIQQAETIGRLSAKTPSSKIITKVFTVLKDEGYLGDFALLEDERHMLKVSLSGAINKCGVVKPRYNVSAFGFEKFEKRYLPAKNMGVLIVSTPRGIMTHRQAMEKKTGGRLIAYCY